MFIFNGIACASRAIILKSMCIFWGGGTFLWGGGGLGNIAELPKKAVVATSVVDRLSSVSKTYRVGLGEEKNCCHVYICI